MSVSLRLLLAAFGMALKHNPGDAPGASVWR